MSQSGILKIVETNLPPDVATNYIEDVGNAVPAANILHVIGGTGIMTSGSGNTITITNTSPSNVSFAMQTGTLSVTPTAGGIVTFSGAVVSAGTNPVRTDGTGAHTMVLEVQKSQALAAADATKIGLSNFDSAFFTVDANGFVSGKSTSIVLTLTGNSGTATPTSNNINIVTANSTVKFVGAGSTVTQDFGLSNLLLGSAGSSITVASNTTSLGNGALTALTSGISNTAIGSGSMIKVNSGNENVAVGYSSLANITGGGQNVAVGTQALAAMSGGSNNVAIGYAAGSALSSGNSNNIYIGANQAGVAAENNTTRIGNTQTRAFVKGVDGVNVGSVATVVTEASDQLGTATLTAGTGTTITPTANTITITSFTPNTILEIAEDFIASSGGNFTINGNFSWATNAFSSGIATAIANNAHPGVISNPTLTANAYYLFLGNTTAPSTGLQSAFYLGGGAITLNWVFNVVNLSNGTNRYTLRFGFGDTTNADQVNGVYFEYSDNINSGNWVYKTASASTRTTTNSSTAVATGWHNAQITINAAASSISFSLDGVSLGAAITTNIPTAGLGAFVDLVFGAGSVAAGTLLIDLFYLTQILTTAR